jgi:hypothetical protein
MCFSWCINMDVYMVSLMEQELYTLPEHMSSPPVFSGVRVTRSLVLWECFADHCCPFVLFLLAIVLSVLRRYTDSDDTVIGGELMCSGRVYSSCSISDTRRVNLILFSSFIFMCFTTFRIHYMKQSSM